MVMSVREVRTIAPIEQYRKVGTLARRADTAMRLPLALATMLYIGSGACAVATENKNDDRIFGIAASATGPAVIGAAVIGGLVATRRGRRRAQEMATEIASLEGRHVPDPLDELRRCVGVVMVLSPLLQEDKTPELQRKSRKNGLLSGALKGLEELDKKLSGTSRNLLFTQSDQILKNFGFNEQKKKEIRDTAYQLAEDYWSTKAAKKDISPQQKRYAYQMSYEIRRRLGIVR